DAAIEYATRTPGPVCLLDIGDNVGGGAPGDGTALAHALSMRGRARLLPSRVCESGSTGASPSRFALVCINDPDAVQLARRAGVNQTVSLTVGGKLDTLQGPPLSGEFHIRSLHDGHFEEPAPRHGGKTRYAMGPCAVIES